MVDIEGNESVQDADWLKVDDPIFGQTQQFDRCQFVNRKIIDILEYVQVHVAQHQALYPLHSALRVPEHCAFHYQASLQLGGLAAVAIHELRAEQEIEFAAV